MPRVFCVIGFTVFFTLALLFGLELTVAYAVLALALLAAAVLLLVRRLRGNTVLLTAALSVAFACVLQIGYVQTVYLPQAALAEQTVTVRGEIASLVDMRYGRYYYIIDLSEVNGEPYAGKVRLSLAQALDAEPTDEICGEVTTFLLGSHEEGLLEYYKSQGVFVGAYTYGELQTIPRSGTSLRYWLLTVRQGVIDGILRLLPNEYGGLILALLLGSRSYLSANTLANISAVGISHLIAVSGQHLSILCWAVLALLAKLRLKRRAVSLLSMGFVLFFMALTGFSHSVSRAGIMMLILLLGNLLSRQADALNSLGIALLLLCCISPFYASSVGLQLSALATLGLLVLTPRLAVPVNEKCKKIENRFLRSVAYFFGNTTAATVGATLLTLPVAIVNFGQLSLMTVPANLLLLLPASACLLLGGVTAVCTLVPFLGWASRPLALVCGLVSKVFLWLCDTLAGVPYILQRTNSRAVLFWLAGALLLVAAAILLHKKTNRSFVRLTSLLLAATFAATLCIDTAFSFGAVHLYVAEVGNGMAVVLTKGRQGVLLGGGGDAFNAAGNTAYLLEQALVADLDAVLLCGLQSEQASARDLLQQVQPKAVYLPQPDADISLLVPPKKLQVTQEGTLYFWNSVQVSYLLNDAVRCAYVQANGAAVLILFSPTITLAALPAEWLAAKVLVTRGAVPQELNSAAYSLVVLSATRERAIPQVLQLQTARANAACSGVRIQIGADGALSARRVAKNGLYF